MVHGGCECPTAVAARGPKAVHVPVVHVELPCEGGQRDHEKHLTVPHALRCLFVAQLHLVVRLRLSSTASLHS